jgi:hypothetical protein
VEQLEQQLGWLAQEASLGSWMEVNCFDRSAIVFIVKFICLGKEAYSVRGLQGDEGSNAQK